MSKPLVGVIGSAFLVEDRFAVQMAGERNLRAVADVAESLPESTAVSGFLRMFTTAVPVPVFECRLQVAATETSRRSVS